MQSREHSVTEQQPSLEFAVIWDNILLQHCGVYVTFYQSKQKLTLDIRQFLVWLS